jgi:L-alanine-DL-glutamate epimerase and related enzymes of enolase superfamily
MGKDEITIHANTYSKPSDLRITDMKVCDVGGPLWATIIKIETNQGIEGYAQVREGGSRVYATMLKRLIIGENPCNVDRLFRRIKQFGSDGHISGGVSAIEIALWDIAGKAYGIPAWQLMGGKFRDQIRVYCDTDMEGKPDGKIAGNILKKRREEYGYTFLKMDLSVEEICFGIPGAVSAPTDYVEKYRESRRKWMDSWGTIYKDPSLSEADQLEVYRKQHAYVDLATVPGPLTGLHVTEKGLDLIEEYISQVRDIIGYEMPLAVDHIGHICWQDSLKLAKRLEKYSLAWMEDPIPWQLTDQLAIMARNTTTPLCTGEDIYSHERFLPLLEKQAVSVVHPDMLTCGGIMEAKKISDLAQKYGVQMAIHMNESPIAAMAAVNAAAACENFTALEFHHNDLPWWSDVIVTKDKPIIKKGFIDVPNEPGLGIEKLNDEVLREHLHPIMEGKVWLDTDEWDSYYAVDYTWL